MSAITMDTFAAPGITFGDLIDKDIPDQMSSAVIDTTEADVAVEVPVKAKTPRKTPVKKTTTQAADAEDVTLEPTVEGDAEANPTKPAKKPRKTPVKKGKAKPVVAEGEDATAAADDPTTPEANAPKKRVLRKKSEPVTTGAGEDVDMNNPPTAKASGKKRAAPNATGGETPAKKGKAATGDAPGKRGKVAPEKFPECWSDFSDTDKLIVNMRKSGKGWPEIEAEWTALSGKTPGTDSLRKRFAKLQAVAVEFNEDDLPRIAEAKKFVEQETAAAQKKMKDEQAAALKKLNSEKWAKIAERVKNSSGNDYKALMIEHKWNLMKKNGELDENEDFRAPARETQNLSVEDRAETNDNDHVTSEADAEGETDHDDVPMEE